MIIDEDKKYILTGNAHTDHDCIIMRALINEINRKENRQKVKKWHLSAPDELWDHFRNELKKSTTKHSKNLLNHDREIDTNYDVWKSKIGKIAENTIGKTMIKSSSNT